MHYVTQFEKYIRAKDELAPSGFSKLHIRTNMQQKTFIGGLLSFAVSLYVAFVFYTRGRQMLGFMGPKISSVQEGMDYKLVGKRYFTQMSKPLLEILEGGDIPIDIDALDYRKYIHIRVAHIMKNYIDGQLVKHVNYHEVHRCRAENFDGNEY
jgi:hypothetical protein